MPKIRRCTCSQIGMQPVCYEFCSLLYSSAQQNIDGTSTNIPASKQRHCSYINIRSIQNSFCHLLLRLNSFFLVLCCCWILCVYSVQYTDIWSCAFLLFNIFYVAFYCANKLSTHLWHGPCDERSIYESNMANKICIRRSIAANDSVKLWAFNAITDFFYYFACLSFSFSLACSLTRSVSCPHFFSSLMLFFSMCNVFFSRKIASTLQLHWTCSYIQHLLHAVGNKISIINTNCPMFMNK